MSLRDLAKKNIPWKTLITVSIITFIFSLIVDVLMRKPLDYVYAFVLAIIFAVIFSALQYLISYRIRKLQSKFR